MTLSHTLYTDLIGKPFAHGARGPAAYDCLGLCMEVLRRRGIAVPEYVSDAAELHRNLAAGTEALAAMRKVLQPRGGEVALFRALGSYPCHMGVMINPWHMLHTTAETQCVVERVASPLWKRRLLGYFEPAEVEAC